VAPEVVVQVSAGRGMVNGDRTFGLNVPASWAYFDANEAHELRNAARHAVELVEINDNLESRPPSWSKAFGGPRSDTSEFGVVAAIRMSIPFRQLDGERHRVRMTASPQLLTPPSTTSCGNRPGHRAIAFQAIKAQRLHLTALRIEKPTGKSFNTSDLTFAGRSLRSSNPRYRCSQLERPPD
jgi:hypothetical protein